MEVWKSKIKVWQVPINDIFSWWHTLRGREKGEQRERREGTDNMSSHGRRMEEEGILLLSPCTKHKSTHDLSLPAGPPLNTTTVAVKFPHDLGLDTLEP